MLRPISDYEKTYQIEKIIGRGQYGIIFLVQHKETGQQFAAKKVDGNYTDIELNILFQLKHPNIITVYECFKDDNTTIFIMEYCKKGDLWNLIQYRLLEGKDYGFNQRVVEQWLIQLLMGLAHIHDNNILHRDLKSMNILIKDDGQLKITDFGVAKVLKQNNFANTITGSPYYLSPEISQGLEYSYASDIWSLGCIIFELCTLKHAFEGKELDNVLQNIQSGRLSQEILIEDQSNQEKTNSFRKYTPELINLIKSLLNLDPNKRPTAKDLLKTPYLAKIMLQSFSKPKQTKQSTTSLQDMDKIGHVTMMQKKAHEKYDKQMNYVKSLLGSKDSINAQSQVLNTQDQLFVKKQTSI